MKVGITMTSLGSIGHLTVSLTLFTNTARRKTAAMGGAALSGLDHGDPADADGHDAQDPDSGDGRGAAGGMQQATGADHRT